MCYTGRCIYESYPWGRSDSCQCTKPAYTECPTFDEPQEEEEDGE